VDLGVASRRPALKGGVAPLPLAVGLAVALRCANMRTDMRVHCARLLTDQKLPNCANFPENLYSGGFLVSQKYSDSKVYVTFILKQKRHFGTVWRRWLQIQSRNEIFCNERRLTLSKTSTAPANLNIQRPFPEF